MVRIADALSKAESERKDAGGHKRSPAVEQDIVPSFSSEVDSKSFGKTAANKSSSGSKWDERLSKAVHDDPLLPEIFRNLRSRILHPPADRPRPRTVLIMSVAPGEGKSFVTANLGISLSQSIDPHCLLVDCDLRRPSLSKFFGLTTGKGLVDYLRNGEELSSLLVRTSLDKLSILPSGKTPKNPSELLGSARMRSLVAELAERYEDRTIIFDSPPTQVASETLVLAGQVDGIILVVREGGAGRAKIKRVIDSIEPDRFLGLVFNGHTTNIVERYVVDGYKYQGYY